MSVRIMTLVWDLELSASQKIVLLALADCANDEGLAWPGVASLCHKCSKSERTVQTMLAELEKAGHITRNQVLGKGCRYQIHPGGQTPANSAPRKICAPQDLPQTPANIAGTPAKSAPKPSKNHQEPSGGAREAREPTPDLDPGSDGWEPPALAALPDKARALVEQWPAGAYQAVCETFRLHWLAEPAPAKGKPVKRWPALLARWLMADHGKVMRDARAGVSFAALAPPAPARAAQPMPGVLAQVHEMDGAARREALRSIMPTETYERFIAPAALLWGGDRWELIVGSEFQRAWIEQNLLAAIKAEIGEPVKIEVERPAGAKRGGDK